MLNKVAIRKKVAAGKLIKFLSPKQRQELEQLVAELKGKKIIQVNATDQGGGVAELLESLVPYIRSLGLMIDWYVIDSKMPGKNFFNFTNNVHNALQGKPFTFTKKDWAIYQSVNKKIAADLVRIGHDVLLINDPQPLYAAHYLSSDCNTIYYSHIDTSAPYQRVWKMFIPVIETFDRYIFSNQEFINRQLPKRKICLFTPAIDPYAPKQKLVPRRLARSYLAARGVPLSGPLFVQVSRFDIWKNPLGVIEAFQWLDDAYPNARLMLVGFNTAKDNPAARKVFDDVAAVAKHHKNIYLFYDPSGYNVSKFTVMAQNAADVVIQNSIKEGFGLTVAEAMWKGKPVIGGPASGVRKQITHGRNGYIVKNSEELAKKMTYLLEHPRQRRKLGLAGRRSVKRNFLMSRLILDHLRVYSQVLKKN
jgi:trehalose synthase